MEYIFGMLFLKRINDQFDFEREEKKKQFNMLPAEALDKVLENAKAKENNQNHRNLQLYGQEIN